MFEKIRETIANSLMSLIDANLEDLPENADLLARSAAIKYTTGDLRGAIEAATSVIGHDPTNAEAFHLRCRAKYDLGQTVSALHDALRDIEIRNQHGPSFYILGNIYLRLENYFEACKAYTNAMRFGGDSSCSFAGRGYAYYGMERLDDALADLEMAKSMGYNADELRSYITDLKTRLESDG